MRVLERQVWAVCFEQNNGDGRSSLHYVCEPNGMPSLFKSREDAKHRINMQWEYVACYNDVKSATLRPVKVSINATLENQ